MSGLNKATVAVFIAIIFSIALSGWALAQEKKTAVGREVIGVVSAIDVPFKALVVKAPHKKDATLTVGAILDDSTTIIIGGQKAALGDIKIGDRVRLNYIRTENQLIAKRIEVLSAKKK